MAKYVTEGVTEEVFNSIRRDIRDVKFSTKKKLCSSEDVNSFEITAGTVEGICRKYGIRYADYQKAETARLMKIAENIKQIPAKVVWEFAKAVKFEVDFTDHVYGFKFHIIDFANNIKKFGEAPRGMKITYEGEIVGFLKPSKKITLADVSRRVKDDLLDYETVSTDELKMTIRKNQKK